MDRDKLQLFVQDAEAALPAIRGGLLVVAQCGDTSDLGVIGGAIDRLRLGADAVEQHVVAELACRCRAEIDAFAASFSPGRASTALDLVAHIEAALWSIATPSDNFDFDVAGFVDVSFANLISIGKAPDVADSAEEFEIDEEALEIFRAEADELLTNIDYALLALALSPDDQTALWDVRRNAHTLKGAAGIVGLTDACRTAHRMEDLLDRLVETGRAAAPEVLEFLETSAKSLAAIVAVRTDENEALLTLSYERAMHLLAAPAREANGNASSPTQAAATHPAAVKPSTAPIVRVSLDRLDEIIRLSGQLSLNHAALSDQFAKTAPSSTVLGSADLGRLFETGRRLGDEIQAKLRRIRMVKFSNLETRLNRAVNVTCQDEDKKAAVEVENGEIEIDTLLLDALVEPLLHLLKNAVVHGLEDAESRRLIGKPERGLIRIRLDSDHEFLSLTVTDDGGGISIPRLKAEAISKGLIDSEGAAAMDEDQALELIFDRGLTTAAKLDLNAGRGVGMSIVKESIEIRGGSIAVRSEPQRGTAFEIRLPLALPEITHTVVETASGTLERSAPLVLIVDDSSSVRHQTAKLVKEAGLRVIAAANGAEALELLLSGEWEPDLILSDVEMPHVDGWALLEYLKTDDNLGHIPVVMVTSLDADEHRKRAFDLGAADYVTKPAMGTELGRILGSLNYSDGLEGSPKESEKVRK